MALCVKTCFRCDSLARNGGSRWHVRLAVASFTLAFFCFFLLLLTWPQLGGSRDELLMKPLRRGCVFFEEASCQASFVESKVLFFWQGRHAVISSCRARLRRWNNRSSKAMAVVARSCLEGESFARNGPFFKTALSLWRRADFWDLRVTAEFHGQRSIL